MYGKKWFIFCFNFFFFLFTDFNTKLTDTTHFDKKDMYQSVLLNSHTISFHINFNLNTEKKWKNLKQIYTGVKI